MSNALIIKALKDGYQAYIREQADLFPWQRETTSQGAKDFISEVSREDISDDDLALAFFKYSLHVDAFSGLVDSTFGFPAYGGDKLWNKIIKTEKGTIYSDRLVYMPADEAAFIEKLIERSYALLIQSPPPAKLDELLQGFAKGPFEKYSAPLLSNPDIAKIIIVKHVVPRLEYRRTIGNVTETFYKQHPVIVLNRLFNIGEKEKAYALWIELINENKIDIDQKINSESFVSYFFKHIITAPSGWAAYNGDPVIPNEQKAKLLSIPFQGETALQCLARKFSKDPTPDNKNLIINTLRLNTISIAEESGKKWFEMFELPNQSYYCDMVQAIFNEIPEHMINQLKIEDYSFINNDPEIITIAYADRRMLSLKCILFEKILKNDDKTGLEKVKRRIKRIDDALANTPLQASDPVVQFVKTHVKDERIRVYLKMVRERNLTNIPISYEYFISFTIKYFIESMNKVDDKLYDFIKNLNSFFTYISVTPDSIEELKISIKNSLSLLNNKEYWLDKNVNQFIFLLEQIKEIIKMAGDLIKDSELERINTYIPQEVIESMWLSATPEQQQQLIQYGINLPHLIQEPDVVEESDLLRDLKDLIFRLHNGSKSIFNGSSNKQPENIEGEELVEIKKGNAALTVIQELLRIFESHLSLKSNNVLSLLTELSNSDKYARVREFLRKPEVNIFFKNKLQDFVNRGVKFTQSLQKTLELFDKIIGLDINKNPVYLSLLQENFSVNINLVGDNFDVLTRIITEYQTKYKGKDYPVNLKPLLESCNTIENNALIVNHTNSDAIVLAAIENDLASLVANSNKFTLSSPKIKFEYNTYTPNDQANFNAQLTAIFKRLANEVAALKVINHQVAKSFFITASHFCKYAIFKDKENVKRSIEILCSNNFFDNDSEKIFIELAPAIFGAQFDDFNPPAYFGELLWKHKRFDLNNDDVKLLKDKFYIPAYFREKLLNTPHYLHNYFKDEKDGFNYLLNCNNPKNNGKKRITAFVDILIKNNDLLTSIMEIEGFKNNFTQIILRYFDDNFIKSYESHFKSHLKDHLTATVIKDACVSLTKKNQLLELIGSAESVTDNNDFLIAHLIAISIDSILRGERTYEKLKNKFTHNVTLSESTKNEIKISFSNLLINLSDAQVTNAPGDDIANFISLITQSYNLALFSYDSVSYLKFLQICLRQSTLNTNTHPTLWEDTTEPQNITRMKNMLHWIFTQTHEYQKKNVFGASTNKDCMNFLLDIEQSTCSLETKFLKAMVKIFRYRILCYKYNPNAVKGKGDKYEKEFYMNYLKSILDCSTVYEIPKILKYFVLNEIMLCIDEISVDPASIDCFAKDSKRLENFIKDINQFISIFALEDIAKEKNLNLELQNLILKSRSQCNLTSTLVSSNVPEPSTASHFASMRSSSAVMQYQN